MDASFNKVILMGTLTKDPELKYIPNGTAVCNLSLVVTHSYTSKAGDKKDETAHVTVVVWGKQAENCGKYLKTGSGALVEGRLQERSWEGKDGKPYSKLEVVAERVQFVGRDGTK